jgi:hypothetical protein
MYTNSWVANEFANAPFSDERMIKRLMQIADGAFSSPASSIPEACQSYSATRAAYRFFNNKKVMPEAILMTHREKTIERMSKHKTVLVVQDTTSLDYRTHSATKGLGNYSNFDGALGLKLHTALAVTEEGIPLGILARKLWARDLKEFGKRHSRDDLHISDKESQRWLDTLNSSLKHVPQYINTVTVCDREADIYEFFNEAVINQRQLLVRVSQNRLIKEEGRKLFDEIESKPVSGYTIVETPRDAEGKRTPREATLSIKFCPVTIKRTRRIVNSTALPSLKLYLVLARETDPPQGVEPINWLLITTLPIENMEQAIEKIKWYRQRWRIERYHYVLKSGCKVEELQLESSEGLQNAIAVYSVVAWKLLWLKYESETEPELPCDIVLDKNEWQALYCVINRVSIPPTQPPTLKEATLMIAKLGGFLGRKSDGNPGVKVIWRGLRRLNDIAEGWAIFQLPTTYQ